MDSTFGRLLDGLIRAQNVSQAAFARSVGLSPQTVNHFVRGIAPMPLKHVETFADRLHLTGSARASFITEAHLTHASPLIREEFRRLQRLAGEGQSGIKSKAAPRGPATKR